MKTLTFDDIEQIHATGKIVRLIGSLINDELDDVIDESAYDALGVLGDIEGEEFCSNCTMLYRYCDCDFDGRYMKEYDDGASLMDDDD